MTAFCIAFYESYLSTEVRTVANRSQTQLLNIKRRISFAEVIVFHHFTISYIYFIFPSRNIYIFLLHEGGLL
jgi:hypothetical protein